MYYQTKYYEKYFFSVIIPAYNRESTINYCLSSVFEQTFPNFEVIVVDDGSQDNTAKEILAFSDERLRYICHERSKGAQAARNTGIKAAQGQWIAFLDSDDEWLPNKLEKQIQVLESYNFNQNIVLHANLYRFNPSNRKLKLWVLPIVEGKNAYYSVLRAPGPVFQTLVVAKLALEEIDWLDEKVPAYQEWDTAIRLARTCQLVQIHEPLAIYWLHAGETISKNKQLDIDGYRYVIEKHQEEIRRVAGISSWHRHLMRLSRRYTNQRFFDEAILIIDKIPKLNLYRIFALAHLYLSILTNLILR